MKRNSSFLTLRLLSRLVRLISPSLPKSLIAMPRPPVPSPNRSSTAIAAGELVRTPRKRGQGTVRTPSNGRRPSRSDISTDGGGRRRIGHHTDDGAALTFGDLTLRSIATATSKLDDEDLCGFARGIFASRRCPSDRRGGKARHHHAHSYRASRLVSGGRRRRKIPLIRSAHPTAPLSKSRALFYGDRGALKFSRTAAQPKPSDPRGGAPPCRWRAPYIAFRLAARKRAPAPCRRVARRRRRPDTARRYPGRRFRSTILIAILRSDREGVTGEGFAASPSLTRANALVQYLFVNWPSLG